MYSEASSKEGKILVQKRTIQGLQSLKTKGDSIDSRKSEVKEK